MDVKKVILSIFLTLVISNVSLPEEKWEQPLSLEELQDPKSPSYVPIPYPKNRQEIIVDLEYIIKRFYLPRKGSISYGDPGKGRRILPKLLEKDSELYIGKIVRASSRAKVRAKEYIVIDIHDSMGTIVARVSLEDSGLFAGASYPVSRPIKRPLMDLNEVKELLSTLSLPIMVDVVESIEYELYIGCSSTHPYLRIETSNCTLYMNTRDEIFRVIKREAFSPDQYRGIRENIFDKRYRYGLTDLKASEMIYLEKIK